MVESTISSAIALTEYLSKASIDNRIPSPTSVFKKVEVEVQITVKGAEVIRDKVEAANPEEQSKKLSIEKEDVVKIIVENILDMADSAKEGKISSRAFKHWMQKDPSALNTLKFYARLLCVYDILQSCVTPVDRK